VLFTETNTICTEAVVLGVLAWFAEQQNHTEEHRESNEQGMGSLSAMRYPLRLSHITFMDLSDPTGTPSVPYLINIF
jgi:hypothetical protein